MARLDEERLMGLMDQMIRSILTYLQDKWVEHDREIWQLKRRA